MLIFECYGQNIDFWYSVCKIMDEPCIFIYLVIQVSFHLQAPIKGLFRAYSTDVLTLHILTFSPKRKSKTKREETLQTASASNFCIASSLHTQLKNGIIPLESFFILWIFWCCHILSFYNLKLCSCSSLT